MSTEEELFESWWRSLPPGYDPEVKELYKNAYISGFQDAMYILKAEEVRK